VPFYEKIFASYNTLKYTYFENKTAEIDVQAIVRKFLVRILRAIRYLKLWCLLYSLGPLTAWGPGQSAPVAPPVGTTTTK